MTQAQVFEELKQRVLSVEELSADDAERAFDALLSGTLDPIDITAFLIALKMRGETTNEILGAARVLRRSCDPTLAPEGAMDTCGTGGDGLHTLNISTAAALVLAAGGVPVAKHGNRSVSSKSGSTDVLGAFGVSVEQSRDMLKQALAQFSITYMPDSRGRLKSWHYWREQPYWKDFISLCTRSTPPEHVEYLKRNGIKTITAGKEHVDYSQALDALHRQFGT
ncbi:MAG: hypothetical protein AAF337_13035, partial [Pseudomonadota bacterium]